MSRIVIVGGRGWFGGAAADLLRRDGERPLVASRRSGSDLLLDCEDPLSIQRALLPRDVVVDAAGPFQRRSTVLLESCLRLGCDLIDLSDSLDYAERVRALVPAIDSAGTRVLTSCSSVSTVSAALVRLTGVHMPVRVSAFLAPATKNTSTAAAGQSLLASLERPIRVRRGGVLVDRRAFGHARRLTFPPPIGRIRGRLAGSPDALLLPLVWPTLRDVDFWIDTRREPLNVLLSAAARHRSVYRVVAAMQALGRRSTRYFGATSGGFAVEVEDGSGRRVTAGFAHETHSYLVAVAPSVLAATTIKGGRHPSSGFVTPDRHVDPEELVAYLRRAGVHTFGLPDAA